MKNSILRVLSLALSVLLLVGSTACGKTYTDSKKDLTVSNESATETEKVIDSETGESLTLRKLKIDNTRSVQENFLGINAVWQGYMYMPDAYGREYSEKQIAEELERVKKMELKMARTYYDWGLTAVYNEDGTVKKNADGSICWDYDNDLMKGLYKWIEALKGLDIEVALNLGWGANILGETTVFGHKNPFYGMTVDEVTKAYSDWVARSIEEIVVKRGYTNVTYGIVFTEPYVKYNIHGRNMKELTEADKALPGGELRQTDWYCDYAVPSVVSALKKAGIRDKIKLVGPNVVVPDDLDNHPDAATITIRERVQWFIDKLDKYIDVYSFHWYAPRYPGTGSVEMDMYADTVDKQSYHISEFTSVLNQTGKEFWFDEMNYVYVSSGMATHNAVIHNWSGTQLSELLIANMNAGLQNQFLWSLNDIQWPLRNNTSGEFKKGVHMTGTYPSLNTSATPYSQYYGYTLLSKYLGGGEGVCVFAGSGKKGVYSTMVKQKNGNITVMVVNTNVSKQAFRIDFDQAISEKGVKLNRHLYNPEEISPDSNAEIIGIDKVFTSVSKHLQDTLPPGGVALYTTRTD